MYVRTEEKRVDGGGWGRPEEGRRRNDGDARVCMYVHMCVRVCMCVRGIGVYSSSSFLPLLLLLFSSSYNLGVSTLPEVFSFTSLRTHHPFGSGSLHFHLGPDLRLKEFSSYVNRKWITLLLFPFLHSSDDTGIVSPVVEYMRVRLDGSTTKEKNISHPLTPTPSVVVNKVP